MKELKEHGKKWTYWFILGLALIIAYKLIDNFGGVLESLKTLCGILRPFLIAIFIAYLLYIPCRSIEKTYQKSKVKFINKKARGLSVLTVYIIALLIILILINVIMPVIIQSIIDLFSNIQGYVTSAINRYNALPENSILKGEFVNTIVEGVQNIDIKQYFEVNKMWEYFIGAVNIVTSVFNIFVAIIVSIYILLERSNILKFLRKVAKAVFEEKTYQNLGKYFHHSNEIFFKFIYSQFLDAVVVGILITVALSIMKVKYAPLLGFMIGLFNMIPYFGAIVSIIIAAIITLITGNFTQTIWMLIVSIILQQIDANVINPKIIGKTLKISPVLVIFAVTVGGAYFGILGMFLAVPVSAVIKILVENYLEMRLANKK